MKKTEIRTYSKDEDLIRNRRNHIAKIAAEVFYHKGYKGTTMRELTEALGMTPGAIYRYIGSKEDILHLICRNSRLGEEELGAFTAELGDISATDALKKCIKKYFQVADNFTEGNIFFNREIHNFSQDDRRVLLESQVSIVHIFERLLSKGIETGEFEIESAFLMAHNILMVGHDWCLRRWLLRQYFTLEEYTEIQIACILRAVGVDIKQTVEKQADKRSIGSSMKT